MQDHLIAQMPGVTGDALHYRKDLGLSSFPVDAATKKPRMKRWQNGGLRAEASIEAVFGRYVDEAVIGIPGGQRVEGGYLLVLDVDERNGGPEALSAHPELPETATAKTPDGVHHWFVTPFPHPTVYVPGLELKGAGSFVIVPPAPGRYWIRDPFEFEIAPAPAWLLQPQTTAGPAQVFIDPLTSEVSFDLDLSDPIELVRRAKPGSRRGTLLTQGGRVAFRTRGTAVEGDSRRRLEAAARQAGVEQSEIDRILDYVFRSSASFPSGEAGGRSKLSCHTLSDREMRVLKVVTSAYEAAMNRTYVPFENLRSDIFSLRYLAQQAGLSHQQQAKRVVDKLVGLGLLWRHPVPKRLKEGQRPVFRYRPTYAGMALAGVTV